MATLATKQKLLSGLFSVILVLDEEMKDSKTRKQIIHQRSGYYKNIGDGYSSPTVEKNGAVEKKCFQFVFIY